MSQNYIITALLVYTILREILFIFQLNRLVNKLMSRNYQDYQLGNNVTKEKKKVAKRTEEIPEDLGVLYDNNPLM